MHSWSDLDTCCRRLYHCTRLLQPHGRHGYRFVLLGSARSYVGLESGSHIVQAGLELAI